MASIWNYLRIAFLKFSDSRHPGIAAVALLLLAIPLFHAASNIALGLLVLISALFLRKFRPVFDLSLVLPVALFLLMALSLFWTIDPGFTAEAILKESPLLFIPLCFAAMPAFSSGQRQKIVRIYSFGIVFYCCFYLAKASIRFLISGDPAVFFYHELVTMDLNAIHVSVYVAIAFFHFLTREPKRLVTILSIAILLLTLFLLSSKNILIVFSLLVVLYGLFFSNLPRRTRLISVGGFCLLIVSLGFVGKVRQRFAIEYQTMISDSTLNTELSQGDEKVYNVSVGQAWSKERFAANEFFSGTAFRVYQLRIFFEMLKEDRIFWTGYGLNASYPKIREKISSDGLYLGADGKSGYQNMNFHNQYVQNFAELGIFGFLLLVAMLGLNLKKALQSKDFVHISFAVLMISLFLTESFIWRQRGVMFFTVLYCLFNAKRALYSPAKDKQLI